MIGIIDYNMGNLTSVKNSLNLLKTDAKIVTNPNELENCDKIILPGVGAFGDAMHSLQKSGMKNAILDYTKSNKKILAICLGMQLLFEKSYEFGNHKGLGLINGDVIQFDKKQMKDYKKIPHIGWNSIKIIEKNKLFKNLDNPYLYFVHSYHIKTSKDNIIGTTNYGYEFTSAINHKNIYGFQPHPEKSHNNGLKILKNFIRL